MEWGLITINPVRGVRKNRETPRERYVTDEELEQFTKGCPEWLQIYIAIKILTGLRQQDLLALKWGNISSTHLCVHTQKTNKRLNIKLTNELSSLITSLPKLGSSCFVTKQGKPHTASGFASIWQRLMEKFVSAGNENFHEHDLRGKVATDMGNAALAQRLLGHKTIAMTEAYVKQRSTDEVKPHTRSKK